MNSICLLKFSIVSVSLSNINHITNVSLSYRETRKKKKKKQFKTLNFFFMLNMCVHMHECLCI